MVPGRSLLTLVVLGLSVVLAGCAGDGPEAEVETSLPPLTDVSRPAMPELTGLQWQPIITDPAGDAWAEGSWWARDSVGCPKPHPALQDIPIEDTCWDAKYAADVPNAGVPAHPSVDLLAVDVAQHADALIMAFTVSELLPDLEGSYDAETGEYANWAQSISGPSGCFYFVAAFALPTAHGVLPVAHALAGCGPESDSSECSLTCARDVPVAIEPGSPGRIVVAVPKSVFGADPGLGTVGAAWATRYSEGPLTMRTAILSGDVGPWYQSDDEARPASETLVRLDPLPLEAVDRFSMDDSDRMGVGPTSYAWRLTRHESWADSQRLHAIIELASLPETAANTTISYWVGLDGANVDIVVHPTDAGWQASATASNQDWTETTGVPVDFEIEPGRPGRITLEVQRNHLPRPGASNATSVSGYPVIFQGATALIDAGVAGAVSPKWGRALDFFPPGPAMRLPPVDGLAAQAHRFRDAGGDEAYPPEALVSDLSGMDIHGIEFGSDDPDMLRVTMTLAGGATLDTPPGYDATFYAVAVNHALGTTMVGHYRGEESLGGEYLCAPDTTVLRATAQDPTLGGWTEIPGRIVQTSGGGAVGGGGSASTSIVLFVPRSCYDIGADEQRINATTLGAGTYLIRRSAAGSIHAVDTWQSDEPSTLGFAPRPVEATVPAGPFGIENFWDILGVAVAVAFAAAGAAIIVGKRVRMKRYLVRLEELADQFHDDPEQYARELVALRQRLYKDFLANRLTEGHFVMVEERLRSALSGTRINAFGHAFYDLPPALMIRLQSLLADGRFSPHDHGVLKSLVEKLKIPAASRRSVHAQLELWATQDAAVARLAKKPRARR